MALGPYAIISLKDFRDFYGVDATLKGQDAQLEAAINRSSRQIEGHLSRRLICRAPIEDIDGVVAQVAITSASLTVIPLTATRPLVVDVVDPSRTLTAGTLTITGTVAGATAVREVDISSPGRTHVPDWFSAIASVVVTGAAGQSASTKVQVGTTYGYVEYLSPAISTAELRLIDWPVIQVSTVHEDIDHTYGATTLLTQGTDYSVDKGGQIIRLYASDRDEWDIGWRVVKATYSAGYTRSNVPEDLKLATLKLVALYWKEQDRKQFGISGVSDSVGNWSRYAPGEVTRDIADLIEPYRRVAWSSGSGSRPDYDMEDC